MKKYYVTVNDEGKEVSRKLTTHHEVEDFELMSLLEISEVYYETTAEYGSKVRKILLLEDFINERHSNGEYLALTELEQFEIDSNIKEANNNIIDAQEEF